MTLVRSFAWLALFTSTLVSVACATTSAKETPPDTDAPAASSKAAPTEQPQAPSRFDARLSGYAYPFEVKFHAFSAQGLALEMAYMDVGPRDGPVVLLLHGKNFSGAYWAKTITDLVRQGRRVVVPDQIGFGKSSKPAPYHYSFASMVTQTAALLDVLGVEKVAVVGHSMGGMVATRFALMLPQRTTRLALVNPIGLEDWQAKVPYAPADAVYKATLHQSPDDVRAYMQASYFDGQWKPAYDDVAEIQMGWRTSQDKDLLAWVAALTADMVFTQPVVHDFHRLTVPTLLIIGTRDRTALGKNRVSDEQRKELGRYDRLGKATHEAIKQSTLVELPGIGHMPQVEDYEAYIQALGGFLR